jgi:hypothetical protein
MDMRKCDVCKKEFDFDTEGLEGPGAIVCGNECATKSAESRGRRVIIHDKAGDVVETNVKPTDVIWGHFF